MKKKKKWILMLILCMGLLKACGGGSDETEDIEQDVNRLEVDSSVDSIEEELVDILPPVISSTADMYVITPGDNVSIFKSSFTATDETDGDITDQIVIDDSEVNYEQPGTYSFYVSVADKCGNESTETFEVHIEDFVAPVIALTSSSFSITEGDSAPNYRDAMSASDNLDGELSNSVEIDDSNVNYNEPGTYEVYYKVADSSGNEARETVYVTVAEKIVTRSGSSSESTDSSVIVLITKTGECYHRKACGRGNYYEVSLETALSKGLRKCEKCY